jgi:4-carboxymuconolactone decarboxylase
MKSDKPASTVQQAIGDFAPKLAELSDEVLFGDVWKRPELSKRDHSLITYAALVTAGKTERGRPSTVQLNARKRPGTVPGCLGHPG